MQVHYGEGLANHTDPESCAVYREVCGEALTGERTGPRLSMNPVAPHKGLARQHYSHAHYLHTRADSALKNAMPSGLLGGRFPASISTRLIIALLAAERESP